MYKLYFKFLIDIFLSLVLLVILSPLFLLIFLIIKFDGGPAFYTHERIGLNNKKIKIIKFRSMYIDADKMLEDILLNNEIMNKQWSAFHKLDNDPRVTKFGELIRKTYLDEIPQLINVLFGDMSIVGPRPITQEEFDLHFKDDSEIKHYQSLRPGITGFWQVNNIIGEDYKERIKKEMFYVRNVNFFLDVVILLKTLRLLISKLINIKIKF